MSDYLTTRELATLLRIKERKVYDLAASGQVPCTKATGKLLFPRREVERWLAAAQSSQRHNPSGTPPPAVFLGSHDPLLEWALRESCTGIASAFDSSLDGLTRFQAREGMATGMHLLESASGTWNIRQVQATCGGEPVVLVAWARRRRGLLVRRDDTRSIQGIADLPGQRLAARQAEAGAQHLLRHLLARDGVDADAINVVGAARSELDAALMVSEGKADVAFGLEVIAKLLGLPFVPVIEECFDLLVDRHAWFEPAFQTFWAFCQGAAFATRARDLAGYDISDLGAVRFNGPPS